MVLKQMRNEAIDMLVLWAASKEYSAEIEAVLKHWASTFEIPDIELNNRLVAAANGELSRPCSASANAWTRMILQAVAPSSGTDQQQARTAGNNSKATARQ